MKKILIVDDSNSSRISMKFSLSQKGFEVLTAENGRDGLRVVMADSDIDVIITDINMPIMNGHEMIANIRTIDGYKTTPIIALSVDEDMGQIAIEQGATAFIIKSSKSSEEVRRFLDIYIK